MRFFATTCLAFILISGSTWETDFDKALLKAREEHKMILLNFSGSDWCVPCIRLHDEIFENESFKNYADSNLVLVNADFPRQKKHQLPKEQQKSNDKLADKYDPQGSFPYTLLLNEKGELVKAWEGYPNMSPEQFVNDLKAHMNAKN